jgi:hypothetical protein
VQSKFTKKKPAANAKARHIHNAGDTSASKKIKEDENKVAEDPYLLEVKVLSCLSPSCIYVAFLAQEKQMNR